MLLATKENKQYMQQHTINLEFFIVKYFHTQYVLATKLQKLNTRNLNAFALLTLTCMARGRVLRNHLTQKLPNEIFLHKKFKKGLAE